MKTIICACGKDIQVDDDDYLVLSPCAWYCSSGVVRCKRTALAITVSIMGKANEINMIDHKDRNNHNNQKSNLREATRGQNAHNSKIHTSNTVGYRGVYYVRNKFTKPWRALITHDQTRIQIGYFQTKEEAAMAYNIKAKELYGEFATLNTLIITT